MSLAELLEQLKHSPGTVQFSEVIKTIEENYTYQATRFSNGEGESKVVNEVGSNEGSCKIFAFAQLNNLDAEQTLSCFGDYYRVDVLENPDADDHANIRNFINSGWKGITFDQQVLTTK